MSLNINTTNKDMRVSDKRYYHSYCVVVNTLLNIVCITLHLICTGTVSRYTDCPKINRQHVVKCFLVELSQHK